MGRPAMETSKKSSVVQEQRQRIIFFSTPPVNELSRSSLYTNN